MSDYHYTPQEALLVAAAMLRALALGKSYETRDFCAHLLAIESATTAALESVDSQYLRDAYCRSAGLVGCLAN